MKDYKLELFLLHQIRAAFAITHPESDTEFHGLIQKFQSPDTVTDEDRELALKIFQNGRDHLSAAPADIRDELALCF